MKYILVFILLTTSCSKFGFKEKLKPTKHNTCKVKESHISVFSNNKKLNSFFKQRQPDYDFLESYIYWSFINLITRPDATAVNSKVLTYIKYKGKDFFITVSPKEISAQSFFMSISEVLKNYNKKTSLVKYAYKFNQEFPSSLPIEEFTQSFITKNKSALYKNKNFKKLIFKGNQVIKKGESIPTPNLRSMILPQKEDTVFITNNHFSNSDYLCNFDGRLYSKTPTLQMVQENINTNSFGLFKDTNNFFISVTNSIPILETYKKNSFILQSKITSTFNAGFCISKKRDHLVIAKNTAHTEQLLSNVINSSLTKNFSELINKRRFINLLYPQRSIIEVYGKGQISSDFISRYYVPTLGNIQVIKPKESGALLYSDPRALGKMCN